VRLPYSEGLDLPSFVKALQVQREIRISSAAELRVRPEGKACHSAPERRASELSRMWRQGIAVVGRRRDLLGAAPGCRFSVTRLKMNT
jgi:hypothetical protein